MKKLFQIFLFIAAVGIAFGVETYIETFTATSNGKDIVVEFKTLNEKNVLLFELERAVNNNSFKKITTLNAKGFPSYYKYVDQEAFLKDSENDKVVGNSYSYRIKIVFKDGTSSYSNTVNVQHKVNGFYRSWGMIKEMFR